MNSLEPQVMFYPSHDPEFWSVRLEYNYQEEEEEEEVDEAVSVDHGANPTTTTTTSSSTNTKDAKSNSKMDYIGYILDKNNSLFGHDAVLEYDDGGGGGGDDGADTVDKKKKTNMMNLIPGTVFGKEGCEE